ncbi:SPOR domain-containing protein [Thermophagus sp. OGC60D27]|uniref:SPOR domain-containing protein n=1 Tax=Thermophagus sp. OGC60D27 TaxID=3458415 RepID=UPI004037F80B
MNKILLVIAAFLFFGVACKNKKEQTKPVPAKQEISKPAPTDTLAQDVEVEETVPEPVVEPDKYFLIAGSFANSSNAESFKKELTQQGFDAQVIIREGGINSEFYKVSYMGFKNKKEAISRMVKERQSPGKEDVWVLVKK